MKFSTSHFSLAAIAVAVASLAACGGGGSSGVTPNATATISTTVMDGLIQNALVCVDSNANGLCDTGEVQGRTDANGQVSLTVAAAEVASARLVAMVGIDAVDADTGPVTTAYTLTTPAGRHGVISPLTTLVKAKMDRDHAAGKATSADDAAAFVQSELTLKVSVFDDFIAKRKSSSEHQRAGDLAHGLAVLAQTSNCGWALGKDDKSKDDDATKDAARKNENRIHSGLLDKVDEIKSLDFSRASCKNGYSTECDDEIKRKVAPVPMTSCIAPPTATTGSGTATTPVTPAAPVTPTPPVDPATPVTPGTPVTPTQPVTPAPPVTTTAAAANGKAVYAASCAMCHGSNAALGANKILRGANSASSILRAISGNQGNMGYLATSINATLAEDLAAFLAAPSL